MTELLHPGGFQSLLFLLLVTGTASLIALAAVGLSLRVYRRHNALKEEVRQMEKNAQTQAEAAHRDPLTGLMNRRLLQQHFKVKAAQADKTGDSIVVCYLDLDGFKAVNDGHGHGAGDELLARLARRLGRCLRTSDTIARVGGDEFVILLDGIREPGDCTRTVTKMIHAVSRPVRLHDPDVRVQVGASVGLSIYPSHAGELDTLLHYADNALYRAKRNGKGRYLLYMPKRRALASPMKTDIAAPVLSGPVRLLRRKGDVDPTKRIRSLAACNTPKRRATLE